MEQTFNQINKWKDRNNVFDIKSETWYYMKDKTQIALGINYHYTGKYLKGEMFYGWLHLAHDSWLRNLYALISGN